MSASATAINLQTRSGNRIIATIGGKQVGLMQSLRMNDDYSPEPASGIGDLHVVEYVPGMARHTLNVSMMVLNTGSLYSLKLIPDNGNIVLQGIVLTIEAYSKDDGSLIRKYLGCSYASGDYEITKHAIVMQTAVFNCLDTTSVGSP
jgi:hypothetical protein